MIKFDYDKEIERETFEKFIKKVVRLKIRRG